MTETQRGNSKQPPWHRDADGEAVPFGPWLRRQREMREITLREISDATKISLRYLQALEDERFDLLPAMVFAKGFLRQYARYVGLDQDEVVNRFLVAHRGETEDEEDQEAEEQESARRAEAFDGTWKYVVLILAVTVILLGLVFLIPYLVGGGEDGETSAEPPPGVAPPRVDGASGAEARDRAGSPADASQQTTGPPPSLNASSPPRAPLRVTLDFREDCWVEATVDGQRRVSEMRVQGESLQLQAEQTVEVRLGNAGVVDVEVNGRPYPLEARRGEVQRVRIDLDDLRSGGTATPEPGAGDSEPGEGGAEDVVPAGGEAAGSPS